jgi:protoheme IX farnesyltransferase
MIRSLSRLFRLRLAFLNGIAALGGYLLLPAEAEKELLLATLLGVTLLAAGGSALNQVQERDLDRLMERTRDRPLPRGDLTPAAAMSIGGACILAGLLVVGAAGGYFPVILGSAALVWYLGVYTPLKRRTTFALAVGALCGAFPPVIGWCIAGGRVLDYRVMMLAGLLYLWQIPHFWLFQHRHADDFRRAGFPLVANSRFVRIGATPLCRLWIIALAAAAMLLPAFGIIESPAALWYAAAVPGSLLIVAAVRSEAILFSCLNLFPLLVTLVVLAQR